jgi:hypothetical protein
METTIIRGDEGFIQIVLRNEGTFCAGGILVAWLGKWFTLEKSAANGYVQLCPLIQGRHGYRILHVRHQAQKERS